jgi:hypothetical protein
MPIPSRRLRALLPFVVAAGAIAATTVVAHGAGDDPTPKPTAEIADVMLAVNNAKDPSTVVGALAKDLEAGTLDEDSAEIVKARASIVVEAGNVLLGLKPPKGADDAAGLSKWKKHVADYRGAAEDIRAAAIKKDGAAAKAALGVLTKRCLECHADHKK